MTNIKSVLSESNRLLEGGHASAAIAVLTEVLSSSPDAQLFYQRAIVLERIGNYQQAFVDYSTAIVFAPAKSQYYVSRGLLLSDRLKDGTSAILDFLAALELDPISLNVRQHLSLCYLRNGDLDNALAYAKGAVAIGPTDFLSHFCLGECLLAKKCFARRWVACKQQFCPIRTFCRLGRHWAKHMKVWRSDEKQQIAI